MVNSGIDGRPSIHVKPTPLSRMMARSLGIFTITSAIPVAGVLLGISVLEPSDHVLARPTAFWDAFANWDGEWYTRILVEGYSWNPERNSSVAFFPLFPLLGRAVYELFGIRPEVALTVVANICFAASFILLHEYLNQRCPANNEMFVTNVLLAMGLVPVTFFCRMAYAESLLIMLSILVFLGMHRQWPLIVIALIIGVATSTRPVGVALIAPFAIHLWDRVAGAAEWSWRATYLFPCCIFGIGSYMCYQYFAFGYPLAFVQTQETWSMRPIEGAGDRLMALLSLEPIWMTYVPGSPGSWKQRGAGPHPLFSLQFANPLYFLAAVALLFVGIRNRWLTRLEIVYCVPMLAIPYFSRGFEMNMASQGRYVGSVVPLYIVLGFLLCHMSLPVKGGVLAISGLFLGIYAALFAAWYMLI